MTPVIDEFRARDINAWADRFESAQWIPSLIRLLILSSPGISSCEISTHEQTNRGGWDGVVQATSASLNVPEGASYWELSKESGVERKALSDIKKRTTQTAVSVRSKSSLVIVTLRLWPAKKIGGKVIDGGERRRKFEQDQKKAHRWKAVKVIDAEVLATWLSHMPGVAIWLAEVTGARVEGAFSLRAHWDRIQSISANIRTSVFLASRRAFSEALEKWIANAPSPFEAQSYSGEELRDALSAWWVASEPRRLNAVAVKDGGAWNYLAASHQPLLLLADESYRPSTEQIAAAVQRGHFVVTRVTSACVASPGARLPRLHAIELAAVLRDCGFEHHAASKVAKDAAGSGVVLKALLGGSAPEPLWAKPAAAREVAAVVLIGAWVGSVEGDRKLVSAIFGKPYEEIESLLIQWAETGHLLVQREGENWRVVAWEYAWRYLAPHVTTQHLERFHDAAGEVFHRHDPKFDLPPQQRPFAKIYGTTPPFSENIRTGFAEALCLLRLRSTDVGQISAAMQRLPSQLIRQVLTKTADWRLWASLGYSIVFFAEACPEGFLNAVERDLESTESSSGRLLQEHGDSVFGGHPHVDLMWALQVLLWDRKYVVRGCLILARLAARDPGGNCGPRPGGVLRDALIPWCPQSCLDADGRAKVASKVKEVRPEYAWALLLSLLPNKTSVVSEAQRPSYLAVGCHPKAPTNQGEYWDEVGRIVRSLVELAGTDLERWETLIGELDGFPPEEFASALAKIEKLAKDLKPATRFKIWGILHDLVANHRFYATAEWAMHEDRLQSIDAMVEALRPADPVLRHAWLFRRSHDLYLPGISYDPEGDNEHGGAIDQARLLAFDEVFRSGGLKSVGRLAKFAGGEESWELGKIFADRCDDGTDQQLFPAWLSSKTPQLRNVARGYASRRMANGGWPWLEMQDPKRWTPKVFARLGAVLAFSSSTWLELAKLGARFERAYWQEIHPRCDGISSIDLPYAIQQLVAHERWQVALECANSARLHRVPISACDLILILNACKTAFGPKAGARKLSRNDVHCVSEIFRSLHRSAGKLPPPERDSLEELEYFFHSSIHEHVSAGFLHARLRREPAYYIELLKQASGRRRSRGKGQTRDKAHEIADHAARILGSFHQLPGSKDGAGIDSSILKAWVADVRKLAARAELNEECDDFLGNLLASCPASKDGRWPHESVCSLLTSIESPALRLSFEVATFNRQGDFRRRDTSIDLEKQAAELDFDHPNVAAILRDVAERRRAVHKSFSRPE